MSNLGKLLAPKSIRKNLILTGVDNSPHRSSTKFSNTTKPRKCDLWSSQLAYLQTSPTLSDTDSKLSNFESELAQEVFRSEICSILSQNKDKLPFVLCEEYNREMINVERVSNPFLKNVNENNEDDDYSEIQRITLEELTRRSFTDEKYY